MLFLELALIRWLGSNVIYLSFFTNLVLLGSFLGIGIGFLAAGARGAWLERLPWALLLLVGFVLLFPVRINRATEDILFFGDPRPSGLPIWLTLPVIFSLVVAIMAMVGQAVARAFARFDALSAYRLDVLGSLLGIAAFSLMAYLHSPPVVWAASVAILIASTHPGLRGPDKLALGGLVIVMGAQSLASGLIWSPYYQISVQADERVSISVNGIPHQTIYDVGFLLNTIYAEPYRLGVAPHQVLVIGAGNGNDVALALSQGAEAVDAVEIDPRLYELGVELHPDRPYNDPRVSIHVEDGRAFMERTQRSYDLILFALPDSLTLVSGQSGLRLESYLFTQEAISKAKALLKPGGLFVMYNFYREQWLIDRLAGTLAKVYQQAPCVTSVGDEGRLAMLAIGGTSQSYCPSATAIDLAAAPAPVTDDYPFLYLRDRSVPGLYLVTIGIILAISVVAIRLTAGGFGRIRPYMDLLAMGAAFLLLETKSVVQFALWFGTTWVVNSLVFAGILVSVLAAIEVTRRCRLPRPGYLYAGLFVALLAAWLMPPAYLFDLAIVPRWLAATVLTFTPIFLANVVFAQRFARTASSTSAFGANLLGAMIGGVTEYGALVVGYRALLLVVAALYAGALLLAPRRIAAANP
jgi:SAM-dependent methyltransferase